jgi:hypothetical protein
MGEGLVRVGRRVGRCEMLLFEREGAVSLLWFLFGVSIAEGKRGGDIPSNGGFGGRQSVARN